MTLRLLKVEHNQEWAVICNGKMERNTGINMSNVTVTSRLSEMEVVEAITKLISRFADRNHEALKQSSNRRRVFKNTGVMYKIGYMGKPNKIVFSFFIPSIKRNSKPVITGVLFDMDDFHKDHEGYTLEMIEKLKAGIKQAKEGADGLQLAASDGELKEPFK